MQAYAKLLTSIAALVGAAAWPVTFLVVVLIFRAQLQLAMSRVPLLLDRVKKASLPGIALELDRVADAETKSGADASGKITPGQFDAARRIAIQTEEIGSRAALLGELDRLCLEYDSLRRSRPSSRERTQAMTRIVVKMRSLAPSVIDFMDSYKGSGSPGSRLAAITMMQMVPRLADLDWLKDRFSSEQPFIFYHAALALQNAANIGDSTEKRRHLREIVKQALATVESFAGTPDAGTVEVLKMLLSSIPEQPC